MAYSAREGQGYKEVMDNTTAIDKQNETNEEDYHVGDVVELSEKGEHCDGCKTIVACHSVAFWQASGQSE